MNLLLIALFLFAGIAIYVMYSLSRKNKHVFDKKTQDLETKLAATQTELEACVKALAQANERNKDDIYAGKIFSQMKQGVVYIDQNGLVQLANTYAESFLENLPAVGKPYREVLNILVNGNRDYSLFDLAVAGKEQALPGDAEIVTQRGKIPVSGTIIPLQPDNAGWAMVLIFADNSQSVLKMQEQKAFFSTAAHELRSPLTAIHMSVLLLIQKFDTFSREKIIEYLTKTSEEITYLINLVNDFLNVSRIEQGRLTVNIKSFNMVSLTDEVIKDFSLMIKEHKLYITHEPMEALYRNVHGDPVKAKEVLTNLINNSMKYTIQGGITITHEVTNTTFITRVTDTGNGISEETQPLLFKGFFQLGAARLQSSSRGSGLGLYISRKIARLMRGDVALESSEPGKGSTFIFKLPLAPK
jgi:signal transduction histidine kinase